MPFYLLPLILLLAGSLGAADLSRLLDNYQHQSPRFQETELESRLMEQEGRMDNSLSSPALEMEQGSLSIPGGESESISRVGLNLPVRMPHLIGSASRAQTANKKRTLAFSRTKHRDTMLRIAGSYHRACLAEQRLAYQNDILKQEESIHKKISRGIKAGAYAEYERLLADMELAKQTMAQRKTQDDLLRAKAELKNILLTDIDLTELHCRDLAPVVLPEIPGDGSDPALLLLEEEQHYRQELGDLSGGFSYFELGAGQEKEGEEARTTVALSIPLGFFGSASQEKELARLKVLRASKNLLRYRTERKLYLHTLDERLKLSADALVNFATTLIPAAKAYADTVARRYELGAGTLQELYRARGEAARVTLEELETRQEFYDLLFERYRYTVDIDYLPFRSQP